ncbi:MAG: cytochrome c [Pseudomonadota bacterium]|nr:cytochrome c [Pseudomonadota bacterium]
MPAWGKALPPQAIWLIVAYIQSLGGTFPAAAYQPSIQGDRSGEQVAPEIAFEQELDGLPPSVPQPGGSTATSSQSTTSPGRR